MFLFFQEVNKSAGTIICSSVETPSTSSAHSDSSGPSHPAATCWSVSNGALVKTTTAAGVVQIPGGFTLVPGVCVFEFMYYTAVHSQRLFHSYRFLTNYYFL